ncbi:NUDC [Bugula neritina]|uniref:NUDC n=1 Tax=Bugula neritina TaxID=10212 RepID=A0A7J7IZP2_BUGNE|nr:NUDC [Bugula neritina]
MSEEKFDGMFLGMAEQCEGGIMGLMDSFFGFLGRKSDFYTGATQEKVEKMVLDAVRKHHKVAAQKLAEEKKSKEMAEKRRQERIAKENAAAASERSAPKIVEVTDEEAEAIEKANARKKLMQLVPKIQEVTRRSPMMRKLMKMMKRMKR